MIKVKLHRALKVLFAAIFITTSSFNTRAENKIINELPTISEQIHNFSIKMLKENIDKLNLHHIEGIWQFTSSGTEIAICRRDNTNYGSIHQAVSYNIILLYSPNRVLRPGTIMGIITPTPKQGEYDARIYTKSIGSTLTIPKKFTLTLDDDDSALLFRQHRSKFSIKPLRLLPYLWRGAIQQNIEIRSSVGCIRIHPAPTLPREPIYL